MSYVKVLDEHKRQTDIRLALLRNGYRPLPTAEKVAFLKGWPTITVDERAIRSWPLMGPGLKPAITTAIQLEGTMLAIDVDVQDDDVAYDIECLLAAALGNAFDAAPLRSSGGAKFMVLLRTMQPYGMWKTRKYTDPDGRDHMVEVYGGASTRYFSCFGPHTLGACEKGVYPVLKEYRWAEGPTPLDTRPEDLPLIDKHDLDTFLMRVSDLLAGVKGWTEVKGSAGGEFKGGVAYDLTEDMVFDTKAGALDYWQAVDYAHGEADARCSSSFLGDGSHNLSKCRMRVVGTHDDGFGLAVFDHETWTHHYPVDWAPLTDAQRESKALALGDALSRLLPDEVADALAAAKEEGADTADFEARLEDMLATLAFNYKDGTYHWLRRGMIWSGVKRTTLMADLRQYDLRWTGPKGGQKRMSIVDAWEKYPERIKAAGVRFRPHEGMIFSEHGETYLNGYFGLQGAKGDGQTCLMAFLRHLVPNAEEREWLLDWLAAKYQRPWERNCAVLFVAGGVQGAGRGTLFSILDRVFDGYTAIVSENDLLAARFNGFMEQNLILFCNEMGGMGWSDRKRGYETLKDRVDPNHKTLTIERKGIDQYVTQTVASFMLATNNPGALTLDPEDRRIAILTNGDRLAGPLLQAVIDDGLDAIAADLRAVLADREPTRVLSHAPHFAGREQMLTANDTELDDAIRHVVDSAAPWRAWVRSDFEKALKLEMTGSTTGRVPGLRGAISDLVGLRAERAGVWLVQERVKVGAVPVAVLAKDVGFLLAATPDDRAKICRGVPPEGVETVVVPFK